MKKSAGKIFLAVCLHFLLCFALAAQEKIALIIGNSAYKYGKALPTPENDANDAAAAFNSLGFIVQKVLNGSLDELTSEIGIFSRRAAGADMAVFYYAGHGLSLNGKNYIVPVDADLNDPAGIERSCMALERIYSGIKTRRVMSSAFILDASGPNPFRPGPGQGNLISETSPPPQSYILYASEPGKPVREGRGRNSVFTKHFLANLTVPGIDIQTLGELVRNAVAEETAEKQIPLVQNNMASGGMILLPGPLYTGENTAPKI